MIDNGGPAHPIFIVAGAAHLGEQQLFEQLRKAIEEKAPGVSVRDYFAARAPQMSTFWWDKHKAQFDSLDAGEIAWRWHYADAMLAERGKPRL